MKRFFPLILVVLLGWGWSGCATTSQSGAAACIGCESECAEPLNLSDAKAEVLAYIDDGRYEAGLAKVALEAKEWVQTRAATRRPGERLAVVFDLDETLLSNLPHIRSHDFGYMPKLWEDWVATANAPAISSVREVYLAARAADVAALFLTGRKEPVDRPGTEENLRREGMADYAELKLLPANDERRTALERKTEARARWVAEGWTIIATIGDQDSDLGEHAERGFKLPNPFYRIP